MNPDPKDSLPAFSPPTLSADDAVTSNEITEPSHMRRNFRFWIVFFAIGVSTALTALELSVVATALPTIIHDLGGSSSFIWTGSAYSLAATACIPLCGGLAQIFGRRVVMLVSLVIMAVGSAVCGAATSGNMMIAGRTIQGLGGGGIAALCAILISDLVALHERGVFNGLIGIFWSLASGVGPLIGGGFANGSNHEWRWIFYLNIPICGLAAIIFLFFLHVPTPPGTLSEKLSKMDWVGNGLVIGSTTSTIIALTWSGVQYSWGSVQVLVPLVLGLAGLSVFIAYEALVPKHPVVPFVLMTTRTSLSGYIQTFICPLVLLCITFYMPVYFQACHGASPIRSGVDLLVCALIVAPIGIFAGISVKRTQRYRPQLWVGWVLLVVGAALLSTIDADKSLSHSLGLFAIPSVGLGIILATTYFPVLAPLPVSQNALALAYFMFLRNFAQVWGIAVGGTVLQNELEKRVPQSLLDQIPGGTSIAYAAIPLISDLVEPARTEVRRAFADSLKVVWYVTTGIAAIGLLASLAMRGLPLHTSLNEEWALQHNKAEDLSTDKA